jgi:hypothetical protein
MKNVFYLLTIIISFSLLSCGNGKNDKLDTDVVKSPKSGDYPNRDFKAPRIVFDKTEHNFGSVIEGELVKYTFRFTNEGHKDLILSKVSSTCGCTVPDYSNKPIKPGERGQIDVVFNSSGRKGVQKKTITVLSNATPNKTQLKIKANVYKPTS